MSEYLFNDKERSITINKVDLPAPWINYLSNGNLHAFVSQAGGGFAWWKDPAFYHITRYRLYNLPIDSPGYYIYIKHKDGTVWSPTFRPVESTLESFSATHEPGTTVFYAKKGDFEANLRLFITPDYDVMVWKLEVLNKSTIDETVDVFAYVELSQLDWLSEVTFGYYWRHMLQTWYDKDMNALAYLYHHEHPKDKNQAPLIYFATTGQVESFSGDRDAFVGNYRDERNPKAVEQGKCGNEEILSGEPCAALHTRLLCKSNHSQEVSFFLGICPGALIDINTVKKNVKHTLSSLSEQGAIDVQFDKLKKWWQEHLDALHCNLPDKNAQRQINTWSPVNAVHTARYSRAVNANAAGIRGVGIRDSCQDMLAIAFRKPEMAKEMFFYLLTKQYEDGHTIHGASLDESKVPSIEIKSDNHLWLPFLAYSLIAETGDMDLLDETVPFLSDDHIHSGSSSTVWEHLLAAIKFTETHLGKHSLPLTLKGDWNDIINKFSHNGKGESVFAAQQYIVALKYLIELAEFKKDDINSKWLKQCMKNQTESILNSCWNGRWWYRCFDDEGNPVGGPDDKFGKIWINSQSWSVLSGVGSRDQLESAMDAVKEYLDTGIGLMKLYPGFKTWPDETDPFNGYNPGNGENGAIFCHANTWAIIAEAMLGNGNRAWEYYTNILPHNVLQKIGMESYKAEPYAWASNIIGTENPKHGWANVMHMTGTAAWMEIAADEYLLGVKPKLNGIEINPCIPSDWKEFNIKRTFRGCQMNIEVVNPQQVCKGIKEIFLDGMRIEGNLIIVDYLKNKKSVDILVIMG